MMIKGPTGCGKSRFVEHMAWKLGKPLITVACNEDMTASDLVGRFLLDKEGTKWQDGPLTTAARIGAICYLDEVVEARQDTTVVIHPLTDHRRTLPLDKKGELIEANPDFQLVISYNPGYQSLMKDLKQSTKQRFGGLDFDYPEEALEIQIVATESGVDESTAKKLVQIAHRARNLKGHGLDEGISTTTADTVCQSDFLAAVPENSIVGRVGTTLKVKIHCLLFWCEGQDCCRPVFCPAFCKTGLVPVK